MVSDKPPPGPHVPPDYDPAVITAVQALKAGAAEPHQQILVMDWLLGPATGLRDVSYWPGDTHATAFAEGKRFVGLQFGKMLSLNPKAFTKKG